MEELKNKNNFKLPSNKTFGFFFTFVFLILGIYFVDKKILSYFFFWNIDFFIINLFIFIKKFENFKFSLDEIWTVFRINNISNNNGNNILFVNYPNKYDHESFWIRFFKFKKKK